MGASSTAAGTGWRHVCGVFNRDASSRVLYQDGSVYWNYLGAAPEFSGTAAASWIAVASDQTGFGFQGGIDSFKVFIRALSQSEVQSEWSNAVVACAGLVLSIGFDDVASRQLVDDASAHTLISSETGTDRCPFMVSCDDCVAAVQSSSVLDASASACLNSGSCVGGATGGDGRWSCTCPTGSGLRCELQEPNLVTSACRFGKCLSALCFGPTTTTTYQVGSDRL